MLSDLPHRVILDWGCFMWGRKQKSLRLPWTTGKNPSSCQGQTIFLDIPFKPVVHLAGSFFSRGKKEKDSLTRRLEFVLEIKNDSRSAPYQFSLQDCFQIQIGMVSLDLNSRSLDEALTLMIENHSLAIE